MEPTDAVELVAVDVGNTSVKVAWGGWGDWARIARVATRPLGGLEGRLSEALSESPVELAGRRCVVCSVCPGADGAVAAACEQATGRRAEFFRRELPIPLPAAIAQPGEAGADRLLLALGARERFGAPCIVVSAGTAVTVDLVDADGAFAGGAIAPGLGLAARALHEAAEQLPKVALSEAPGPLGRDTRGAIRSGVYWSCAGGVLTLVGGLRLRPGCAAAPLVCTGTDAALLLSALPEEARHAPDLIFDGMATGLEAGS